MVMKWCKWCKKYVREIKHFVQHRAEFKKRKAKTPRGKRSKSSPRKYPKGVQEKVHRMGKRLAKYGDGIDNPYALAWWMYKEGYDIG